VRGWLIKIKTPARNAFKYAVLTSSMSTKHAVKTATANRRRIVPKLVTGE
jgi:hypothetical protein